MLSSGVVFRVTHYVSVLSTFSRTSFLLLSLLVSELSGDNTTLPCVSSCSCMMTSQKPDLTFDMYTVRCVQLNLHDIPNDLPHNAQSLVLSANLLTIAAINEHLDRFPLLRALDLSSNHLYSIREWDVYVPSLLCLRLDSNLLDYLSKDSFTRLTSLLSLSLSYNKLEVIDDDAFRMLTDLKRLDLSRNRISEVKAAWFRDLRSLEQFDINNNMVAVLWDSTFVHAPRIKVLNFATNQLSHIYEHAFYGANNIDTLLLSHNHLHMLPFSGLSFLENITLIDLSFNNFEVINKDAFINSNVKTLLLNYLKRLTYVDKYAFRNMTNLLHLEISNNPSLVYIDSLSFANIHSLETLNIENNNLTFLEAGIVTDLQSLKNISLLNNPIACDCSSSWLRTTTHLFSADLLQNISCTNSSTNFTQNSACGPQIVSLIGNVLPVNLGDRATISCRTTGSPTPKIEWSRLITSAQTGETEAVSVLNNLKNTSDRVQLSPEGDLIIDYVLASDHGTYQCKASNSLSTTDINIDLKVTDVDVHVIVTSVTSHSITVTWKRASYSSSQKYQIRFNEFHHSNSTYRVIDVRPYMRTYTATHLLPQQLYEICMTSQHHQHYVIISCTRVNTHQTQTPHITLVSAQNLIVVVFLTVISFIGLIVCCATLAIKRYNKKKRRQQDPYGDNMSRVCLSSGDSISDMTPITYENRAAQVFDEDDIDEIREAASEASLAIVNKHAV